MDILKDISGSFGTMTPLLTFLFLIIALVLYIFKDTIIEMVKHRRKKKDIKNLEFHDVHATADSVLDKMHDIEFTSDGKTDPYKTKLLHELVSLNISVLKRYLNEFLNRKDLASYSGQRLKHEINEMFMLIENEYCVQADNSFRQQGISTTDSKYLIKSYESFRKDVTEGFHARVESITTNADYASNYDRISAIFEVIAISLYIIPKDAKSACDKINGRFNKYPKK
ncbi:MAG: hypothetical protein HRT69_10895 [Flavobacteriaceae bacterium]|nr:hypothetical protein [Flavobacteriaceae bacterium]